MAWQSTLFRYEQGRLTRIEDAEEEGFQVGIWWHNVERLVICLQSIAEIQNSGNLIDSDLSHDSAWETVRPDLACPEATEYFDVPRGRVMWDAVHQSGIIYHGNSTPVEVCEELARIFRLPTWEHRQCEHYLTGEELEAFYDLETGHQ
jgi:hypothetical protein